MKAAILLPCLASKDAVGNDALTMARVLRERGIDTRLFCDTAIGIDEPTYPAEMALDFAGGMHDLLIYHFSVGWPAGFELMRRACGFRVVKYHNITPPEFFAGASRIYEQACARGRAEIPAVAALGCDLYLGDSAYNLAELVAAGVAPARGGVLAPFHCIEQLVDAEADLALLDELNDGSRNFLMVGRIAPNKGHVELVDAFAAYVDAYGDPARLLLVGKRDPGLSSYSDAIQARIEEHRLGERVWWLEGINEAKLKATYLASSVLMPLSRHEGFCVPIIEAMALGVPVVALGSSAVPETVGNAGIVWDSPDPWLYAASAAQIFADSALRATLRDAAHVRYHQHYAYPVLRDQLLRWLEPAL